MREDGLAAPSHAAIVATIALAVRPRVEDVAWIAAPPRDHSLGSGGSTEATTGMLSPGRGMLVRGIVIDNDQMPLPPSHAATPVRSTSTAFGRTTIVSTTADTLHDTSVAPRTKGSLVTRIGDSVTATAPSLRHVAEADSSASAAEQSMRR